MKDWIYGEVKIHVDPPTIILIKIKLDTNPEKYYVQIKLCRSDITDKSDMYEFKMALIDNIQTEEFLLFQKNYKIILEALGAIMAGETIQYIRTLLRGEALHQFETLCDQVVNTNTTLLNQILFVLGAYFLQLITCLRKIV